MKRKPESTKYFFQQIHEIRKWALIAATFYVIAYTFWDTYRFSGAAADEVVITRLLFMIMPLLLLIILLFFNDKLKLRRVHIEWVAFFAVILIGWSHAQIVAIAANNDVFFPKSGLAIILIYSSLLLTLPFYMSAISSVAIILIAMYAYHSSGLANNELLSTGFFYFIFTSCCLLINFVCIKILVTNQKLVNIIKRQANTDELTGLENRRHFYEHAAQIHKQASRENKNLSILLLDLDNFKIINDKLGHKYGDKVLRKCAEVFKSHVNRPLDLVARLGGDEFVIMLYDSNTTYINQTCQSIIKSIEKMTKKIQGKLPDCEFGISMGVASNDDEGSYPLDILLEMADKALYQIKHQSKNSFTVFDKSIYQDSGQSSEFLTTV